MGPLPVSNDSRFAAPAQPAVFENALYQPFALVLRDEVQGVLRTE